MHGWSQLVHDYCPHNTPTLSHIERELLFNFFFTFYHVNRCLTSTKTLIKHSRVAQTLLSMWNLFTANRCNAQRYVAFIICAEHGRRLYNTGFELGGKETFSFFPLIRRKRIITAVDCRKRDSFMGCRHIWNIPPKKDSLTMCARGVYVNTYTTQEVWMHDRVGREVC